MQKYSKNPWRAEATVRTVLVLGCAHPSPESLVGCPSASCRELRWEWLQGMQDLERHWEIAITIHCQRTVPAGSQCHSCDPDQLSALPMANSTEWRGGGVEHRISSLNLCLTARMNSMGNWVWPHWLVLRKIFLLVSHSRCSIWTLGASIEDRAPNLWLESKISWSGKAAAWLELPWRVYASRLSSLVWKSPSTDLEKQQKQKPERLKKGWLGGLLCNPIGEKKVLASNPSPKR